MGTQQMHDPEAEFHDPELKAILKRAVGLEVAPAGLRERITEALRAQDARPQQLGFDDPDLKQILKRSLGSELAPARLRHRVTAALQARERQQQALRHRWQKPVFRMAAAAVLLIGFGLVYTILFNKERAAPQWFAAAMVTTHGNTPAALPLGIAPDDYDAIRTYLTDKLGYPVLAEPLGDGWTLQSARMSVVGTADAAQLVFTKGDQTVSVFSVPEKVISYSEPAKDGMSYSQMHQGHAISGFVRGKSIHCLVASSKSGKPDLKALTQLREKLRAMPQG
jgi:hypothetical protein